MEDLNLAVAEIIYKLKSHQYLNEEEMKMLHDWLSADTERKEWFDSLDESSLKEQLGEFVTENERADLWNRYQQKFPEQFEEPVNKRSYWKIMMAAASVAIIIGAALYTFFKGPLVHKNDQVTATSVQDIEPGTDKAVLEMSDGRRFVLDEMADGVIDEKGGTRIIKKKGALLLALSDKNDKPAAAIYNTIRTPRGGQYQVTLPDKSKVWLNAGSELTFPAVFANKERRVKLKGEGYFEVAKGKVPFIVAVQSANGDEGTEIKVLGTHFNIRGYENDTDIKATLLEGKVQVSNGESVILSPGQQASVATGAEKIKVKAVEAENSIAWKNNLFVFEQSTISEITNTIQRWYDVEVEIKKSSSQQFNATIPRDITIKKLFRLLEEASDGRLHFRLEGKKVVVQ